MLLAADDLGFEAVVLKVELEAEADAGAATITANPTEARVARVFRMSFI